MRTHCQTGRFTYRPHLLMADRTVEIGKHGFYLLRDGRRDYRIDYDEITALRFSELQETGFLRAPHFTLAIHAPGRVVRLTLKRRGAPQIAYFSLLRALLERIALTRPDLEVELGQTRCHRLLLAGQGVKPALLGGSILCGALLASDMGLGERLIVLGIGFSLLAWGLRFFVSFNPAQRLSSCPAISLAAEFADHAHQLEKSHTPQVGAPRGADPLIR